MNEIAQWVQFGLIVVICIMVVVILIWGSHE